MSFVDTGEQIDEARFAQGPIAGPAFGFRAVAELAHGEVCDR
jgi:hypothetical protein